MSNNTEKQSPETYESKTLELYMAKLNSLNDRKTSLQYEEQSYQEQLEKDDLSTKEVLSIQFKLSELESKMAEIDNEIVETIIIINQEKAAIARGKHYDKYLVFRNIRELLKTSDIKLGQIEKEAGCQAGYMSRMEKPNNATEPTIEFLVTAAKMLGVSLDTLINTTIASFTSTELYMIRFLEKLIRDTEEDKLSWVNEPQYTFKEIERSDDGELNHPLISRYQNHKGMKGIAVSEVGLPYVKIHSYFPSKTFGKLTEVSDDCYRLDMKNQTSLYVMSVAEAGSDENATGKTALELWMHNKNGKISCLCTDHEGKDIIVQLVFKLWKSVVQYDTRPKISKEHRDVIDSFLRDDAFDIIPDNNTDDYQN